MSLEHLLESITEEDAAVIAECIFLAYPDATKSIRPLPRNRLEIYNMVAAGINTAKEIAPIKELKLNNVYTQLKLLVDDGYLIKVSHPDKETYYRISTIKDILSEGENA